MRNCFRAVRVATFVGGAASVRRLAHEHSPAVSVVGIFRRSAGTDGGRCERGGAVEVLVDDTQFLEIMCVGFSTECAAGISTGV